MAACWDGSAAGATGRGSVWLATVESPRPPEIFRTKDDRAHSSRANAASVRTCGAHRKSRARQLRSVWDDAWISGSSTCLGRAARSAALASNHSQRRFQLHRSPGCITQGARAPRTHRQLFVEQGGPGYRQREIRGRAAGANAIPGRFCRGGRKHMNELVAEVEIFAPGDRGVAVQRRARNA